MPKYLLSPQLGIQQFTTTDQLQAANGTPITIYEVVNETLHLKNRTYSEIVLKTDVKRPLLGADLHNLLVDICSKRLIEAGVYSSLVCAATHASVHQLATISPVINHYRKVLLGYQEIIQPTFSSDTVLHGLLHRTIENLDI